jgi:hypothetical protein
VSPLAAYWSGVTGVYHLMPNEVGKERTKDKGVARRKWEKERG